MKNSENPRGRIGRPMRTLIVAAALIVCLVAVVAGYLLLRGRRNAVEARPKLDIRRATEDAIERSRDDIAKLRTVDERLVKYRQARTVATGLVAPEGIALSGDGLLYVVGDRLMSVIDAVTGKPKQQMELLADPTCVTVDEAGSIYVGYRHFVEVYKADGSLHTRWEALGQDSYITSLTTGGDHVWAADAGGRVVIHYNKWGVVQGRLGESGGNSRFSVPSPHFDVVARSDGMLVVSNPGMRSVETYAPEGMLITSWGHASQGIDGFCGCCNPTDIALMGDGRVVTAEKGLPRVKLYTSEGQLDSVVAIPDDFSMRAAGIDLAVDADGNIWALDPSESVVRVFAPKSAERAATAEPGAEAPPVEGTNTVEGNE